MPSARPRRLTIYGSVYGTDRKFQAAAYTTNRYFIKADTIKAYAGTGRCLLCV